MEEGKDEYEVKRLQPYSEIDRPFFTMIDVHSLKKVEGGYQFDCDWNDGQGPKGHVHGGVMSMPLIEIFKDKVVKELCIDPYKKRIPLGTTSKIEIFEEDQENKTKFNCFKMGLDGQKTIEFSGYAILENRES